MNALAMLSAAGLWPAVPLAGHALLGRTAPAAREHFDALTFLAVSTVAGIAVWSPIVLGAAVLGVFSGPLIGLAGWIVTGVLAVPLVAERLRAGKPEMPPGARPAGGERSRPASRHEARRGKAGKKTRPSPTGPNPSRRARRAVGDWWQAGLAIGIALAGLLYLGFPAESIYGGRDEGVYSMHGTWIARHGRLDVPYPWPEDAHGTFSEAWIGFPGFYRTEPTMTVQFGHLFSVWLAQAYATLGPDGLFRLNALFAVLFLGVFYGLCRTALPAPYAVAATLFLAFNPSQLWMARITLSEIPTQLLIWTGLLLLVESLRAGSRPLARWAGVFLGLSALVRFDSLLLVPALLLTHAAVRVVEKPPNASTPVWLAFYQTALPVFLAAFAYFFVFSRPYLLARPYLGRLGVALGASLALLLIVLRPRVARLLRPVVAHPASLVAVGAAVAGLAAYAYWIRPFPDDPSRLVRRWPGYYAHPGRWDYGTESFANMARYLSPVVLWAAVGGWIAGTWDAVRKARRELMPLLVVAAAFSVVYFDHHGNTPDHFWMIRRFVPVVIPGLVVCAALAARWTLDRIPAPWSRALPAAALLFLAGFTIRADSLIIAFAENRGYYRQLEEMAEKLPAGEVIPAQGFTTWLTPLYVAFDRRVVPLNLGKPEAAQAVRTWLERQQRENEPVHRIAEQGRSGGPATGTLPALPGVRYTRAGEFEISRVHTESTIHPLPQKIVTERRRIELQRLEPHPLEGGGSASRQDGG
jgi:hypothetical protein